MSDDFLRKLRLLGLDDEEIISVFAQSSSTWRRTSERSFEFQISQIRGEVNDLTQLATLNLNKRSNIKSITCGEALSTLESQENFLTGIEHTKSGIIGHQVLIRPIFACLPLKGSFRWRDHFQIRPVSENTKMGKGMDFFASPELRFGRDTHVGPPYPFILEIKVNKSRNPSYSYRDGLRLLTEYESLISVLLIQGITSVRLLHGRRWTSIWDGESISYHLLHGGFSDSEDGIQDDFSIANENGTTTYGGNDYYDHIFSRDDTITFPPNFLDLLGAFDDLKKPMRRAFLRSCYWFALGLENRNEPPLALVSFSNAIECLLPRPNKASCKTCLKPTGSGVTKLFEAHLKRYAPIHSGLQARRDRFYAIRSALVHGSKLEPIDLSWLSPLGQERDDTLLLEIVARRALVNWLTDPKKCDPTKPADNQ